MCLLEWNIDLYITNVMLGILLYWYFIIINAFNSNRFHIFFILIFLICLIFNFHVFLIVLSKIFTLQWAWNRIVFLFNCCIFNMLWGLCLLVLHNEFLMSGQTVSDGDIDSSWLRPLRYLIICFLEQVILIIDWLCWFMGSKLVQSLKLERIVFHRIVSS